MRRAFLSGLVTAVGGSLLATVPLATPANADVDPGALASALDLPTGVTAAVVGSGAVESRAFNDFPSKGSGYAVISTGNADEVMLDSALAIDDPATVENERTPDITAMSTDHGTDGTPDTSTLTLTVDPSTAAGCLFVDFAMGTDETIRQFVVGTPADALSVSRRAAPGTEYAVNAGRGYFQQEGWAAEPRNYTTNDIDYWHEPGSRSDVRDGQLETPRLDRWTRLNNVTTRDTARVPLDFSNGADVIDIVVSDGSQDAGEIDTAAWVDNVRLTASCSGGTAAQPAHPYGEGSIKGERRVGYPLSYDPVPSTAAIERYDAADNGWTHPAPAAPVDLRFRWYRSKSTCPGGYYNSDMNNWVPVSDADRQSYVPTNLDRGRCLIVLVSGVVDGRRTGVFPNTDEAGTNPQRWYVTLPIDRGVFQDGAAPSIIHDGTPKVGEEISVSPVHTRPLQDSWSYLWFADGSPITGATSSALRLAAAQRGKAITVRATAQRSEFDSRSWISAGTPLVAGDQMESVGSPSIVPQPDGEPPAVGDTLTADPGPGWPANTSFTYQWRANGAVISGAVNPTYTVKAADAGKQLTVQVSGSKPGFDPVSATSGSVLVSGTPMEGATVSITGTPRVGGRLTGSPTSSGWSPSSSTLTYAWYAGTTLVQRGSSRYYVIGAASVGKPITLHVTGVRSGYESRTVASAPTARVAPGLLTVGTVRTAGQAKVGYSLRASVGSWRPSPVTFRYRWKIGSRYVAGAAGRRSYLKIPRSARGKRITVVVTGSKAGYTTVTRSARSAVVR